MNDDRFSMKIKCVGRAGLAGRFPSSTPARGCQPHEPRYTFAGDPMPRVADYNKSPRCPACGGLVIPFDAPDPDFDRPVPVEPPSSPQEAAPSTPKATKADLAKLIQNILAYPYAWEKVGLGDLPVDKVASYCRDRAAHLAEVIWDSMPVPVGKS